MAHGQSLTSFEWVEYEMYGSDRASDVKNKDFTKYRAIKDIRAWGDYGFNRHQSAAFQAFLNMSAKAKTLQKDTVTGDVIVTSPYFDVNLQHYSEYRYGATNGHEPVPASVEGVRKVWRDIYLFPRESTTWNNVMVQLMERMIADHKGDPNYFPLPGLNEPKEVADSCGEFGCSWSRHSDPKTTASLIQKYQALYETYWNSVSGNIQVFKGPVRSQLPELDVLGKWARAGWRTNQVVSYCALLNFIYQSGRATNTSTLLSYGVPNWIKATLLSDLRWEADDNIGTEGSYHQVMTWLSDQDAAGTLAQNDPISAQWYNQVYKQLDSRGYFKSSFFREDAQITDTLGVTYDLEKLMVDRMAAMASFDKYVVTWSWPSPDPYDPHDLPRTQRSTLKLGRGIGDSDAVYMSTHAPMYPIDGVTPHMNRRRLTLQPIPHHMLGVPSGDGGGGSGGGGGFVLNYDHVIWAVCLILVIVVMFGKARYQ